jgi:hypothetical protein
MVVLEAPRHYVLNERNEPQAADDFIAWATFMGAAWSEGKLRVAETTLPRVWVSTVFLGVDYLAFARPPKLYETMVFFKNGEAVAQRRYETRAQAFVGHQDAVTRFETLHGATIALMALDSRDGRYWARRKARLRRQLNRAWKAGETRRVCADGHRLDEKLQGAVARREGRQ